MTSKDRSDPVVPTSADFFSYITKRASGPPAMIVRIIRELDLFRRKADEVRRWI